MSCLSEELDVRISDDQNAGPSKIDDVDKPKTPDLLSYLQSFNREIPEKLLDLLRPKEEEEENERDNHRINTMRQLFEKYCCLGYKVMDVTPLMSETFPYCRWIVTYMTEIPFQGHHSKKWQFDLVSLAKPPAVFPISVLNNLHFGLISANEEIIIEYGVKHCGCAQPTAEFVEEFNADYPFRYAD